MNVQLQWSKFEHKASDQTEAKAADAECKRGGLVK